MKKLKKRILQNQKENLNYINEIRFHHKNTAQAILNRKEK